MEEYPVYIGGERSGTLTVAAEGIRTRFSARCTLTGGLVRLSVYGGGRSFYLGLMQPRGDMLELERVFSRAQLRELPPRIEYASDAELELEKSEDELWYSSPCGVLISRSADRSLIAIPSNRLRSFPTRVINGRLYAVFPGKRRL